jgi:hypothetical protein
VASEDDGRMSSVNLKKMQEREAKAKEEAGRARAMMGLLAKMAVDKRAAEAGQLYEQFASFLNKSSVDPSVKDKLIQSAKQHAFLAHRAKLDEHLEKAMECARIGDQIKKLAVLKMADQCLDVTRKLTDDKEFLREVQKRIELARETGAAGQSERAKNQVERNDSAKAHKNEKRRYIRYVSPTVYVRFGRDATLYKAMDYSLTGLQVEGIPPGISEGDKVSIAVTLEPPDEGMPFNGTATVARVLTDKNAIGIRFPSSAEGPIMAFVRERRIDLNLAEIAKI